MSTLNKKIYIIEKKLKISIIFFSFALSTFIISFGPSIIGGFIAIALLVLISWIISDMELMNPLTWFPPVFFMYSVSFPMLVFFKKENYIIGIEHALFLEWVALVVLIVVLSIPVKYKVSFESNELVNIRKIVFPIYIVSLIMSGVYLTYIYTTGLNTKYSIALDQSIFSNLEPFFSIFVLSFLILFTYNLVINGKISKILLVSSLGFTILILFVAGERDLFLRAIIGMVFLIHCLYKKIKKKTLLLLGLIGIISIPILSNLKNFAFDVKEFSFGDSIISEIFGGEFMSASRNLTFLIAKPDLWNFFRGETLIWDIQVATMGDAISPGAWFNQTFFPNLVARGGGNGFTLVGEGYMNFGVIGVIIAFFVLGLFLKYLYINAYKNLILLIVYVATIPIVIYAIRGDFATIITHFLKHILIPLVIVYIVKIIISKKRVRKKFSKKCNYPNKCF